MICVFDDCSRCVHLRPLKDGWNYACDAFPDGQPCGFPFGTASELKECNNGIKFEERKCDNKGLDRHLN
jgi:hypothetical protein